MMQPQQEGLSEWIAINCANSEGDRDPSISDLAIADPEESGDFRMSHSPRKKSLQRRDYPQFVVEVNYCWRKYLCTKIAGSLD
jgi:hypothetical protein